MPEDSVVHDRLLAGEPIHIGSKHIGSKHIGSKQIGMKNIGTKDTGAGYVGARHNDVITILPIVRLKLQSQLAATHAWLAASKEPVALVVRDRDEVRTIQFGAALSIEQLRAQIPELDDLIAQYD